MAVAQRYTRVVNPSINRSRWTVEQIDELLKVVRTAGTGQWKMVADQLPGRTDI